MYIYIYIYIHIYLYLYLYLSIYLYIHLDAATRPLTSWPRDALVQSESLAEPPNIAEPLPASPTLFPYTGLFPAGGPPNSPALYPDPGLFPYAGLFPAGWKRVPAVAGREPGIECPWLLSAAKLFPAAGLFAGRIEAADAERGNARAFPPQVLAFPPEALGFVPQTNPSDEAEAAPRDPGANLGAGLGNMVIPRGVPEGGPSALKDVPEGGP